MSRRNGGTKSRERNSPEQQDSGLHPRSLEAEKQLLGSILCTASAVDEVASIVTSKDFFMPEHAKIFRVCVTLHEEGKPVQDAAVVAEELARRNLLAEVGGAGYVRELLDWVPHGAHAKYYAETVRDRSRRRRVVEGCTTAIRDVGDPSREITSVVSQAEERLHTILEEGHTRQEKLEIGDILVEEIGNIIEREHGGIETGYPDLDRISLGMRPGNMVILAARPSMGKTAFALNVIMNLCKSGHRCLFFSLEQSRLEICERMLAMESGVDGRLIQSGDLDEYHREAICEASNRLNELKFFIDDEGERYVSQMASIARLTKRRRGLDLIVVDYLQLIEPDDPKVPREQQVSAMSRKLRVMAKSLDVPVICLAQLNRQCEMRNDKKPMLADLRESGSVEQNADKVWFLWRPAAYGLDKGGGSLYQESEVCVMVRKNRNGKTGDAWLYWDAPHLKFNLLKPDTEQDPF